MPKHDLAGLDACDTSSHGVHIRRAEAGPGGAFCVSAVTAVDLFCGAGGASLGLIGAGFDLRLAADIDPACALTHTANLPGEYLVADLREVDADKVLNTAGIVPGELDLLFAGPPCQ